MRTLLAVLLVTCCAFSGAYGAVTVAEDYGARAWTPLGERGADYTVVLRVTNTGETPVAVRATTAGAKHFAVRVAAPREIAARGNTLLTVRAAFSARAAAKWPPFTPETCTLTVEATAKADHRAALEKVTVPLLFSTTAPLTPPGEDYVQSLRARAARPEWAKASAAIKKKGEEALRNVGETIEPPTEALWLEGPVANPHHIWHFPRYINLVKRPDGAMECPECHQVWTQQDIETGRIRFMAYRSSLSALGMAGLLTGDARYGRTGGEILKAMAKGYLSYPVGPNLTRLGLSFMHESQFDLEALGCLRRLQAAGMISPEDQQQIAVGLLIPSVETLRQTGGGTPNQQALRASVACMAGLTLNWPPYVAWALRDENKGFMPLVQRYIGHDGGWLEGSLSYHELAINWLTPLPAVLDLYGYNVTQEGDAGERLKNFYTMPLLAVRPDMRLPAINDAGMASLNSPLNTAAYRLTRDPRLIKYLSPTDIEFALDDLPKAEDIPWASHDFPDFGIAVLHDGGTPGEENWVLFDYGFHGGGHGHFDKLNVAPYAYGQSISDDPGSFYGSTQHFVWYRNTLCHNTITVDETGQQADNGVLDLWRAPAGKPQIAVASTEKAYPGVRLERAVALVDGMQVYLDRAVSAAEHTYDWTFSIWGAVEQTSFASHERGPLPAAVPDEAKLLDTSTWGRPPDKGIGYDVPTNLREGAVNGNWEMDWAQVQAPYLKNKPAIGLRWLAWSSGPAQIVWGDGAKMLGNLAAPRWVMARQQGKEAVWVTAMVPYRGEKPACTLTVVPPTEGDGIGVQLTKGDRTTWIALNRQPGRLLTVGPLATTEKAAVAE